MKITFGIGSWNIIYTSGIRNSRFESFLRIKNYKDVPDNTRNLSFRIILV